MGEYLSPLPAFFIRHPGTLIQQARSLESVNDYKTFRTKLDSRRLALDAALNKLNSAKKEKDRAVLEAEVELARERL